MKISPLTALVLLMPLYFTSCKSSRTSGSSGSSTSSTPSTSMSRKDYPFDEDGNYHEEWARGENTGSSSKVVDLTKDNPTSSFVGTSDPRDHVSSTKTASTKSKSSAKPTSTSRTKSKTTASTKPKTTSKPKPKNTVITVKKGDTLYGLAKRYGTSVKAIQSANGMGSATALRDGRSLAIPR